MKSNLEFDQEIECLIKESVSKHNSPVRDEAEIKGKKSKRNFFYNRNKIDINEAWKEIESLFENFSIQSRKPIEKQVFGEEQKIMDQQEPLQTPQPKVNSRSLQTTKFKEPKEHQEKDNINYGTLRRWTFNID